MSKSKIHSIINKKKQTSPLIASPIFCNQGLYTNYTKSHNQGLYTNYTKSHPFHFFIKTSL